LGDDGMLCSRCEADEYAIWITREHERICIDCNRKILSMISPTGQRVRESDKWGSGRYRASRGKKVHHGCDYICEPGQEVVSPINGLIVRLKIPYSETVSGVFFSGVLIQAKNCVITLFYFEPYKDLIKGKVSLGQPIGIAQDISLKYPGITPHIHLQIDSINPEILIFG